ncbi:MAG: hypothetical protein WAN51_05000 [Alphaproteobacteria bacterium]
MGEHFNSGDQPMLPVMRSDNGDAFDLLLVVFYEPGMFFESRNIFPAVESGSINQQSDFAVLTDERIDLRSNLAEVVGLQFIRRHDPQRIGSENFCLDHAKSPSGSKRVNGR